MLAGEAQGPGFFKSMAGKMKASYDLERRGGGVLGHP